MLRAFAFVFAAFVGGTRAAKVPRCTLGVSGPDVSCIAFGTLHLHEAGSAANVLTALQAVVAQGITTIDTSDVYNSMPELLGAALQLQPGLREQIEIVAKMDIVHGLNLNAGIFGFDTSDLYDSSCAHLKMTLQTRYLVPLNTSYVDVLMLHHQDYLLDIDAFAECMIELTAAGSVRHVGVSNFDRDMFAALNKRVPLVANEIEVSVLNPKAIYDGTVSAMYNLGASILAWGPVGGDGYGGANRLFKVGSIDDSKRTPRIRAGLTAIGAQLGVTPDVVAVAWLLRHPANIIPIIGTMDPNHLSNQSQAFLVAQNMTAAQWYYVADAAQVPVW